MPDAVLGTGEAVGPHVVIKLSVHQKKEGASIYICIYIHIYLYLSKYIYLIYIYIFLSICKFRYIYIWSNIFGNILANAFGEVG